MNDTDESPASAGSPRAFQNYSSLAAYLDSLGMFRMRPGLARITAVLRRLDLLRPPFTVVQVVGTNGKGSTSTMLASLAAAHGLRTGLCTSPHFVSPRERVRINGRMLAEEEWTALANRLMQAGGEQLTYFECITALAVLAFATANVDIAVMETGLGGTFDATTAMAADMLLYTPIDLDHQAVLGNTLDAIARDKAGAMRERAPVFSSSQAPEAWAELVRIAAERHSSLTLVDASFPLPATLADGSASLALPGAHQLDNARLALAGWRYLRASTALPERFRAPLSTAETEKEALAQAWHPGRMQHVPPLPPDPGSSAFVPSPQGWPPLLLDGAHNAHGLAALGLALAKAHIAPAAVIFACLGDKDPVRILPHLRALATGLIFVPPIAHNPRALPPEELASLIGLAATPASSLREALTRASLHIAERLPDAFTGSRPQNPLLICGSLYLLGEFFALRPDCLESSPG